MVCTANDLQEWKDFPKGLRVLLLDQDSDSASEITSKLQAMDYTGQFIIYITPNKVLLFVVLVVHYYSNSF